MNAVTKMPEGATSAIAIPQDIARISEAAAMLQMIERVIRDPSIDLDRVRTVIDLRRQIEDDAARKVFDAAVSDAKALIPPITKNRVVDFTSQKGRTNYRYEDFGEVARIVDPILAQFGLSYRHELKQEGGKLTVTCVLSHREGYCTRTPLTADSDNSGNKNSIQALASTTTYLQRYTLKAALGLAVSNDDDAKSSASEAIAPDTITEDQIMELRDLLASTDSDEKKFLKFVGLERLSDMYANAFQKACEVIKSKAKR